MTENMDIITRVDNARGAWKDAFVATIEFHEAAAASGRAIIAYHKATRKLLEAEMAYKYDQCTESQNALLAADAARDAALADMIIKKGAAADYTAASNNAELRLRALKRELSSLENEMLESGIFR